MTEFLTLWSPPGSESSSDALDWLDNRSRIDRILVPFMDGFDPESVLPLSAYTFESYLRLADERGRKMLVVPDVLDPGTSDPERGGKGYHRNVPDTCLRTYEGNLEKLMRFLGDRKDLVWGAQAGNEQDYAPEVDAADWDHWTNFQISCLKLLCSYFPDADIVGGGMLLEKYGGTPILADAIYDEFGSQVALDTHWGGKTTDECCADVTDFVQDHPDAHVGCFENVGGSQRWEFAAIAKKLDMVAYTDFNGLFPCETWGNNDPPMDTSDIAVVDRKNGAWVWNEANAWGTSRAAKVLGSLRGSASVSRADFQDVALDEQADLRGSPPRRAPG